MTYDPAFMNTASVQEHRSLLLTVIKGSSNIAVTRLRNLRRRAAYLEVAYLLLPGDYAAPTEAAPSNTAPGNITLSHASQREHQEASHRRLSLRNAHPMGMFDLTLGALGTFYPDAKRHLQC